MEEEENEQINIEGFHGTSQDNAECILEEGFKITPKEDKWMGNAIYFFIKGLSLYPEKQAEEWAIVESWDKDLGKLTYLDYVVLKAKISAVKGEVIDLREPEGVCAYERVLSFLLEAYKNKEMRDELNEGKVFNFLTKMTGVKVVIADRFMKLNKRQRKLYKELKFIRRQSNCTVCAVYFSTDCLSNVEWVIKSKIEENG